MKILITSGGTSQPIDSVRSITNRSTGRLGTLIAKQFLDHGHHVTFVTAENAIHPDNHPLLSICVVETVSDLLSVLERLVPSHDVIIHGMAVSDYEPIYMASLEEAVAAERLEDLLDKVNDKAKISSEPDYQVLMLKRTPKVISMIKDWNPNIFLVGFKLLVNVPKKELIAVATTSLQKNRSDLVVANDLRDINGTSIHKAYLVDGKQEPVSYETKADISKAIYKMVVERTN